MRKETKKSYECRIPNIDNSRVFHIVCSNFRVDTAAETPFEEEEAAAPVAATWPVATVNEHGSTEDVEPNIPLTREIDELRQQGIEVDDDNEPVPENATPEPPAPGDVGEWITPTVCPR